MPKCFLIGTRRAGTLSTFSSLSASCKTKNVAGGLLANKTKKVNLSKRSAVSSLDSSTYLRNLEAHLHERAIMAALSNDSQASEDGKDCNQSTSSSKVDGQQLECKDHIQLDSLKVSMSVSGLHHHRLHFYIPNTERAGDEPRLATTRRQVLVAICEQCCW